MRSRSPANSADSAPPSPALISRMTSLWSSGSFASARPAAGAQGRPQQVAGEQRRLRAALPRLDLEDDVLVVVGVLRQQQLAEPVAQLGHPLLERGGLGGAGGGLGGPPG